jgi:glycosyltransferase involved in cell wall biosynthesis
VAGKYIIAVHSFSYGTSQALRDYLKHKGEEVLFIEHPLFASSYRIASGFLDTLWQVIKQPKQYDLFIGANPLNALAGIMLRGLGKVKRVVYFFLDYTPERGRFYWWLDYFCIRKADEIWNSSSPVNDVLAMMHLKRGVPPKYLAKTKQCPEGTVEIETKEPRKVVAFVGHIKKGLGVELLLEAFREIDRKDWHLFIFGDGDLLEELIEKNTSDKIKFMGYREIDEIFAVLRNCAFAVAPYEPNTISQYTDSGKVKNYLSCGLPVIITRNSPVWKEIEQRKAGLIIDYSKESLKEAMLNFINNPMLLAKYGLNACDMALDYRWEKIFERLLCTSST